MDREIAEQRMKEKVMGAYQTLTMLLFYYQY